MSQHELIAAARASQFQTDPSIKEVQCGHKYYVLSEDGDYCPNCGERLK